MPRSESWRFTLFTTTDDWYRLRDQDNTELYVGIWWHHRRQLVGFGQPVATIQEPRTLIDSNLTHADAWDMARRELSCPSEAEYFSIPRGRILWHAERELGIFYHGNATQKGVLGRLAKLFGLPRWEAHMDVHYLTGQTLDDYFNQE
jgi:hypothetical protein